MANSTWALNDSLWGGETFKSKQNRPKLNIKKGDRFRVEIGKGKKTLIPHPQNKGTWNETYSKSNPIALTSVSNPGRNKRAFSMWVKTSAQSEKELLYLVERKNLSVAITRKLGGGGMDDGTASVEH